MHLVDRLTLAKRAGKLIEDIGKQEMVEVDFRHALLAARPDQPNQHAIVFGAGLEGAIPAEAAHVELVGEVDGDFCLIGDRLHWCCSYRLGYSAVTGAPSRNPPER